VDNLFATETMAELSARQGRLAEAVAIYQHLVRAAEAARGDDPRVAKWQARIAALEGGSGAAPSPPAAAPQAAVAARAEVEPAVVAASATPRGALVINDPVRSGQVIYAEARDLIVVAPVHPGAQLLADGNVHVYGALKGRAVAGAHGARDAQIFCLALEPELVGVDTGYVTSEDIAPALWSGPARVSLTPEGKCAVIALSAGKRAAPANPSRRLF
jgi:septum site-determining protein MinC